MQFTAEQMKELIEGFREHDLTLGVSLDSVPTVPDEQAEIYQMLKRMVKGYMENALSEVGIHRSMDNYTKDHPVKRMMDTDIQVITEESTEILADPRRTEIAIEEFFSLFEPLVETALNAYCRDKNRERKDLTPEEKELILNRVTSVINEEFSALIMLGQQFPALYEIANEGSAQEDFQSTRNPDGINHYRKWNHSKTKIGEMLSLEELEETGKPLPAPEEEREYRLLREAYLGLLDEKERQIFLLREQGKNQEEIAEALGYKNHSSVARKLRVMRKKFNSLTE